MRRFLFFLVLFTAVSSRAQMSEKNGTSDEGGASTAAQAKLAPRMGHNVSSTSYLMGKGKCTIGMMVIGCGASKTWTVATVPWLYFNYNTWSVVNRVRLKSYKNGGNWTAQLSYFQTFPQSRNSRYITYPYEMHAVWLQWIRAIPMNRHYRIYANIHTNYYVNDKRPFSIRRPIPNRNSGQFNLTTLHEIALYKRWFFLAEAGLLEILQPAPPYIHAGISAGRSGISYEWHLGFTLTSTPLGLFNPRSRRDYQQELRDTERGFNQELDREKTKRDYAIHPEFSLQYFF